MNHLLEKAKEIRCLICDVDGVLTDGLLYVDPDGNELKAFHVQDGLGLKLLMAAEIHVAIITTCPNTIIDERVKQLGISLYFKGQIDKRTAFKTIKERLNLENAQIAYVGDDLPDLAIIQQVGLGVAVANAVQQVKNAAIWQTEQKGGRGAVREVCEFILNAQQKQDIALSNYLSS